MCVCVCVCMCVFMYKCDTRCQLWRPPTTSRSSYKRKTKEEWTPTMNKGGKSRSSSSSSSSSSSGNEASVIHIWWHLRAETASKWFWASLAAQHSFTFPGHFERWFASWEADVKASVTSLSLFALSEHLWALFIVSTGFFIVWFG